MFDTVLNILIYLKGLSMYFQGTFQLKRGIHFLNLYLINNVEDIVSSFF